MKNMKKDIIYLDKEEYEQFLIELKKLKKQRSIIASIKAKRVNPSDINWDISEYEEIDILEQQINLQIKQKLKELRRIRFKHTDNISEENIFSIDNTNENEMVNEKYTNKLSSEFEGNTEDILNSSLDNLVEEKELFIVNKIALYFSNNKNKKVRTHTR